MFAFGQKPNGGPQQARSLPYGDCDKWDYRFEGGGAAEIDPELTFAATGSRMYGRRSASGRGTNAACAPKQTPTSPPRQPGWPLPAAPRS
jgi:hypothetical protein